jgi:conjugal transfer pilus assembly protein TraD
VSPQPSRPPYWLVPVVAALLLSPPAWAAVALVGTAIAITIVRGVRSGGARRRAQSPAVRGAVALGVDASGDEALLTDEQLSAHGLILGASGAGKTTTLLTILTDRIRRGLPVVGIDMKGSPAFARELADAADAAGRPFRLWTPDGPSRWNPLEHGNPTELKDKLIATERFTEPHYQRAAERYVQTVLQVLQHARPDRAPTLEEVVRLMDPGRLPAMLRGLPRQLADRVQDYLAGLTPDQLSAVRGLGTRLAILTESHTGEYLAPPSRGGTAVDLRSALAGDEVVLFSLNSSTYGKLAAQLGTLAVQDLVAGVGDRLGGPGAAPLAPDPPQAIVAIDEFSALGGDQVVALLARARESGVSVVLVTQELADLERAARGLRDQVVGVTAVKIAHRQDVPASAQAIAQMAGTEKRWEETRQFGGRLLGGLDSGRGTRRHVEQFVVHPNEIKSLRTGDAVVITKLPVAQARTVRVAPPRPRQAGRQRPASDRGRAGPELG